MIQYPVYTFTITFGFILVLNEVVGGVLNISGKIRTNQYESVIFPTKNIAKQSCALNDNKMSVFS